MKRLLIVVDYQNDFVDGALGFEGADRLYPFILEKIEEYRKDDTVVFTRDTHFDNYLNTEEGRNLPIPHCIKNTKGWRFYKALEEISKDFLVFEKSTFGSYKLFDYLRKNEFDEIELVGLVSSICVISNAIIAKTALPNAHVIVNRLGTSSFDKDVHEKSLEVMKNLHVEIR
ncbi:MAG: cysteine hydrolase family protein [Bacilli bacterium]|jgi:nicotinamidase/pyrazinamidase